MKFIICIIIFLFFLNLGIMKCYAIIARKRFLKRYRNKNADNQYVDKKIKVKTSVIKIFNRYLSGLVRYELRLIGNIPSHRIRKFLYKNIFLMKIGKNSVIYGGMEVRAPWNIKIGDNTIIGDESKLDGRNIIIIKNNVNFSTGVWIWTDQHKVNSKDFESLPIGTGKVIIEDYCWCGPRSIILPSKTMKKGSVLAAGGVLTKNTEEFGIYAGVPAQKISERNKDLLYSLGGGGVFTILLIFYCKTTLISTLPKKLL